MLKTLDMFKMPEGVLEPNELMCKDVAAEVDEDYRMPSPR